MNRKVLAIFSITVAVLSAVVAASFVTAVAPVGAIYTIDNAVSNNVLYYSRSADGSTAFVNSFSTNGAGTGAALASQGAVMLTQDGRWLLVVNAGSNEISVFKVQSSGLMYVSKVSSHGSMPISLTINNKNWVYVLDAGGLGNIAGFMLDNTGMLTYLAGSNQPLSGMASPSPEQIGFNQQGNVLIVTEKGTNLIDTYTVGSDGIAENPATQASNGMGPYGFAFTDKNKLVLSEAATNTLSSYVVSDQGNLRTISGAMPTFGNAPCWVAINDAGTFAYTSNAHGGTISTFSISPTGTLNLVSSIEAKTNVPTLDLAFSRHSLFLYALNAGSITGFRVFNDGSLWQVTSVNSVPASASGLAAT